MPFVCAFAVKFIIERLFIHALSSTSLAIAVGEAGHR